MPIDFNDEKQVALFKKLAFEKGKDPARVDSFIQRKRGGYRQIKQGETLSGIAKETGTSVNELARENQIKNPDIIKAGATLKIRPMIVPSRNKEQVGFNAGGQQTALSTKPRITQRFGNISGVEVFSGGFNRGTDFGVKEGTKIATPPGRWEVIESFGGAKRKGFIRNNDNRGYGNSVVLRNRITGEKIRFSHLSKVGVKPGQIIDGGNVFALSGFTGNATGPHLDVEYIDERGRLRDILKSRYRSFFIGG
ncbi:MAG: hypothetical protein DRP08_08270 [Candidatus Aenigmatarchaeota archaeon]|nr:MAG: hypothetical protein DRP08_08270 [Candidatus Aenigmarchaeota archaeon]